MNIKAIIHTKIYGKHRYRTIELFEEKNGVTDARLTRIALDTQPHYCQQAAGYM